MFSGDPRVCLFTMMTFHGDQLEVGPFDAFFYVDLVNIAYLNLFSLKGIKMILCFNDITQSHLSF